MFPWQHNALMAEQ